MSRRQQEASHTLTLPVRNQALAFAGLAAAAIPSEPARATHSHREPVSLTLTF